MEHPRLIQATLHHVYAHVRLRSLALALCVWVSMFVPVTAQTLDSGVQLPEGADEALARYPDNEPARSGRARGNADTRLQQVLGALAQGRVPVALSLTRALVSEAPEHAAARWLLAELLSLRATGTTRLLDDEAWPPELLDVLYEYRVRHQQRHLDVPTKPPELIQAGDGLEHVIRVDLSTHVLALYAIEQGQPQLLEHHYAGTGTAGFGKQREGDRRTPVGVYQITDRIGDEALPALYGAGALTLDYPNQLDRFHARTGYGIWIHGVPPEQDHRAPLSSEGCVTLANPVLQGLMDRLRPARTLVILADGAPLPAAERQAAQADAQAVPRQAQPDPLADEDTSRADPSVSPLTRFLAKILTSGPRLQPASTPSLLVLPALKGANPRPAQRVAHWVGGSGAGHASMQFWEQDVQGRWQSRGERPGKSLWRVPAPWPAGTENGGRPASLPRP